MTDLKLTEHFTLSEFERSATAEANNINNSCPSQYIPALSQLCKTILEPLRQHFGEPVIISSGYRCNQLNVKVGGAYASQHTLGEAADIVPLPPAGSRLVSLSNHNQRQTPHSLKEWFDWLKDNTDFDQLIMETANGRDYWIHVSCRKNKKANRHQVFYDMKKR